MSSTAAKADIPVEAAPRIERTAPATVPSALAVAPASAVEAPGPNDEVEFRGFGKAIVLGVVIGIPVMMALITSVVKVMDAKATWLDAGAIALWVSLFCGPFLAGTVTVGVWSGRQHH